MNKLKSRVFSSIRLGGYMQWTKRRAEKIVTRLLVTAILAIIAIEILVVVATFFYRK
jgi:hypothetical protein